MCDPTHENLPNPLQSFGIQSSATPDENPQGDAFFSNRKTPIIAALSTEAAEADQIKVNAQLEDKEMIHKKEDVERRRA